MGIPQETLDREGTVSPAIAVEMARSARRLLNADLGVSTTGVAGPTGGSSDRPIGRFYVGVSTADGYEEAKELQWFGDRNANREKTAIAALDLVKYYLLTK